MSSAESAAIEAELVPVPLSTVFCADDADVVIRAAGTRDFRVHKPILSLVSAIFKTMFSLPQPPTETLGAIPQIDVEESAETWENIFQTIYPMPNPVIDDLGDLESLLLAAKKYEMQFVIDSHVKRLENIGFIQQDPLHLYAIACACGFEDQARYVARNAELLTVMAHSDAGDLRGLTVGPYHNFVSFLAQRDSDWAQILVDTKIPQGICCNCDEKLTWDLYNRIKMDLKGPYLRTEEVYLRALEDRSRQLGCTAKSCSVTDSKIKAFIEKAAKERERLCDKFVPGTSEPGLIVPYSRARRKLDFPMDYRVSCMSPFGYSFLLFIFSCIVLWLWSAPVPLPPP